MERHPNIAHLKQSTDLSVGVQSKVPPSRPSDNNKGRRLTKRYGQISHLSTSTSTVWAPHSPHRYNWCPPWGRDNTVSISRLQTTMVSTRNNDNHDRIAEEQMAPNPGPPSANGGAAPEKYHWTMKARGGSTPQDKEMLSLKRQNENLLRRIRSPK